MATKDLDTLDLPKNPSTSEATLGKDHLLYVDNSTTATPVWNLVGGQRGADLTQDADSIDTSHKTSGGWKSAAAGMRSWKLEYSGLAVMGDDGLTILEACYRQGKAAHIKLEYPDGSPCPETRSDHALDNAEYRSRGRLCKLLPLEDFNKRNGNLLARNTGL